MTPHLHLSDARAVKMAGLVAGIALALLVLICLKETGAIG